jgi:glycosyltransferase involved in cell wall biosynthesis
MRKKIIWLCSWYPNEIDRFTGDFIQRQALAASRYADIEVVHIVDAQEDKCVITHPNAHLCETIYHSKAVHKIIRLKDFFQLHESFINDYFSRKGKPDLIHVHIPIKSGLIALRWKRIYKLPFLVTEHYGIYNNEVKDRYSQRNYFFKFFTKRILQQALNLLPVSISLGNDMNTHVCEKAFTVVPNVVNTSLFFHKENKTQDRFRFIHVSNGDDIKNIPGILQAFAKLAKERQHVELVIVGNTSKKNTKLIEGKKWAMNRVHFLPEMTYAEVAKQVQVAHAGILFSFNETQSCAVLEWLCCGLPVITSAVGGVKELIDDTNGILVPPNDVALLTKAMQDMIDNYARYSNKQIAETASQLYSYDAVGKQLNDIYIQAIESVS